jgi:hypothetical protein
MHSLFRASVPYAPLMLWKIKGGDPATVVSNTDFLKGFLATGGALCNWNIGSV